jgi:hypothetical protein
MSEREPDRGLEERGLPKVVCVKRIEDIWAKFVILGLPNRASIGPIIAAAVNCYVMDMSYPAQTSNGAQFLVTRKSTADGSSMYIIERKM